MPAYRSSAEAEVRDAVVARLRQWRPGARIIHEINNGWSNRIDVLCVSKAEIIAVEIKSAKDTLDLLPAQLDGMVRVAHHSIAAVHEALAKNRESAGVKWPSEFWLYPEPQSDKWYERWTEPRLAMQGVLPLTALNMVWKDELLAICHRRRISATTRSTCDTMRRDILWFCTGREWTEDICRALRERHQCPEADPPITTMDCGE